jgi:hypothetical protein
MCCQKVVSGNPDPKHISTSYVQRQNLSMSMGVSASLLSWPDALWKSTGPITELRGYGQF